MPTFRALAARWMGMLVPMVTEPASSLLLPSVENGSLDSWQLKLVLRGK